MITELLNWPVKTDGLHELGLEVDRVDDQYDIVIDSLEKSEDNERIPNINRPTRLMKRIRKFQKRLKKIKPENDYDKLVLEHYQTAIASERHVLEYFFTTKHQDPRRVGDFIDRLFVHGKRSIRGGLGNSTLNMLERIVRSPVLQKQMTRREDLLWEIMRDRNMEKDNPEIKALILPTQRKALKLVRDYGLDRGFLTSEQIQKMESLDSKDPAEATRQRYEIPIPERVLFPEVVFGDDEKNFYHRSTNTMQVGRDKLIFYRGNGTGEMIPYYVDFAVDLVHEDTHKFQEYLSHGMPPALNGVQTNLASTTISEGLAMVSEDNFLRWLKINRDRHDFSETELKIGALYYQTMIEQQYALGLLYSAFNRRETLSNSHKKLSFDAEIKLGKLSGNPLLADPEYLSSEHLSQAIDNGTYVFGKGYVGSTLRQLFKIELERLGDPLKAEEFLQKNEPIVSQGMNTGFWSPTTHRKFFLKHYWPKAREYCESV